MTASVWILLALSATVAFAGYISLWWRLWREIKDHAKTKDTAGVYIDKWVRKHDEIERSLLKARREADAWKQAHKDVEPRVMALYGSLQAIASQETEGANSTVRRMARIAREAMVEDDEGDFSKKGGA